MSWNLKGSYVETCSCELMCPCNLSFDHGATYDFCRATLVFDVSEGEIEGTEIGALPVAVIIDTPKVMTEGNWRVGLFIDAGGDRRAGREARSGLQWTTRGTDGESCSADRRGSRRGASAGRGAA